MTYRQPGNFWHRNFQLGAGVESKLPPNWGDKSPVWIDTQPDRKCANVKDELVELILLSPLPKVFKWFLHLLTSFSSIHALSLPMS